jgi:hypothetical protein
MPIQAMNWPLVRAIAWLKRLTLAVERLAPPAPRRPRVPADFSVASTEDFDEGYDARESATKGVR